MKSMRPIFLGIIQTIQAQTFRDIAANNRRNWMEKIGRYEFPVNINGAGGGERERERGWQGDSFQCVATRHVAGRAGPLALMERALLVNRRN